MKRCKKLLCLVLALVMALSLCTVAMADPTETGESDTTVEITLDGFYYGGVADEISVGVRKIEGSTPTIIDKLGAAGATAGYSATLKYVTDSSSNPETTWIGALDATNGASGNYRLIVSFLDVDDIPDAASGYTLKLQEYSSPGERKMGVFKTINVMESGYSTSEQNGTTVKTVAFDLPLTVENYKKYIPFTKVVELGGNTEPAAKRFELEWVNKPIAATVIDPNGTQGIVTSDSADKHVDVTGYVDTNGAGTYTGNICVTGPKYYVDWFVEQYEIYIREKNDNAAGWTYDDQLWLIKNHSVHTDGTELSFIKVPGLTYDCPDTHENATDHFQTITFTNKYTENIVVDDTINRQTVTPAPEAPATQPVASPKTGDMGVALYAAMALLSMSGATVLVKRRGDEA